MKLRLRNVLCNSGINRIQFNSNFRPMLHNEKCLLPPSNELHTPSHSRWSWNLMEFWFQFWNRDCTSLLRTDRGMDGKTVSVTLTTNKGDDYTIISCLRFCEAIKWQKDKLFPWYIQIRFLESAGHDLNVSCVIDSWWDCMSDSFVLSCLLKCPLLWRSIANLWELVMILIWTKYYLDWFM